MLTRHGALQDVARVLQRALDQHGPHLGRPFDITLEGWRPGRGDYGTEYAGELVELIEARNCGQGAGCVHAGTRRAVRQIGGAGGTCTLLMLLSLGDTRVRGFVHDGRTVPAAALDYAGDVAPRCDRYEERTVVKRGPRRKQPDTLF